MRLAILDDYQRVALELADWSMLRGRFEIISKIFGEVGKKIASRASSIPPSEGRCFVKVAAAVRSGGFRQLS